MIYLDNNATTRPDPAVRDAMLPFLTDHYGNPSSTHRFGQESRQAVEQARVSLARLVGCEPRELIFTSGGTESDNAALHGLLAARHLAVGGKRPVIVTSTVEHGAIREPLAALAKSTAHASTPSPPTPSARAAPCEVLAIPVSANGTFDYAAFAQTLQARAVEIAFATLMWANNETGVLFDIQKIGTLCRQHQIPLHVDAVQAVGKIPISLRDLPIDLLSLSAHKFHGPKGIGALFVRRGTRWQPWQRGGPQELDRRGGTENVPGIVGMGHAAQLAAAALADHQTWPRIAALRDRLEKEILARIPQTQIIGNPSARVASTTNIAFTGLEAEAILLLLSERNICASAGAACSSGSLEPSPVLRAMGIEDRIGHGAVRFSLSRFTTEKEIEEVLEKIPPVITRLRQTLPV